MTEQKSIRTEKFPAIAWQKTGEGPALMLVHGFPERGDLWNGIVPALAAHFTLIIPDLPGAGASRHATESLTVEDMAESLREILIHESIERAVIAGHSMGGYTALAFADLYPGFVQGLSLVHSGAYADDEAKRESRRKSVALIRKGGKSAFIRQMVPNLFAKQFREERPELVERQIERAMQLDDSAMISFYGAMLSRPDRTRVLQNASFPVQWIIGKEDQAIPPSDALRQATIPGTSFISLYDPCGHMSMLEQPERLAIDLADFGYYCNNR